MMGSAIGEANQLLADLSTLLQGIDGLLLAIHAVVQVAQMMIGTWPAAGDNPGGRDIFCRCGRGL